MTSVFSSKLDRIGDTLELGFQADHQTLAQMLAECANRSLYSVGSGGSVVVAAFLAQCRTQLGFAMTLPLTPLAYALQTPEPKTASWFFSASGRNEDIQAAFAHGLSSSPGNLFVLTNSEAGPLVRNARHHNCLCHVSPVADTKDGFLATHSVVASVLALILASDRISGRQDWKARSRELTAAAMRYLSQSARTELKQRLDGLLDCETLVLLHDPQLSAAAALIETSAWEAGLCSVQSTDFRNFAHGRHVWVGKHAERTLVIALIADRTVPAWNTINQFLPVQMKRYSVNFGAAGRAAGLESIAFGLSFVEALGLIKGIDPGKPGVPEFGRKIFDDRALAAIVDDDNAVVRRKRQACVRVDRLPSVTELLANRATFLTGLESAEFGGVVLDYDGTVVATNQRYSPPSPDILAEIRRLIDADVRVAFATGRGGSIGEMLRDVLPISYHERLLIGYYNGAWIAPLATDIAAAPPPTDAAIATARQRLQNIPHLFKADWVPKPSPLQLAIPRTALLDEDRGLSLLSRLLHDLPVRILQSAHAIDVFPLWASKRAVVARVRNQLTNSHNEILCVGDRGERFGNDHELLEGPHGISVGRVCDRQETCWNLSPEISQGPAGLIAILKALTALQPGTVKLSVPNSFSFG